jgi:hypothetical protein
MNTVSAKTSHLGQKDKPAKQNTRLAYAKGTGFAGITLSSIK